MNDALDRFAEAMGDLDTEQSASTMKKLRKVALEYAETEKQITALEGQLSELKATRQELKHKVLPDIMQEAGVDILGLPVAGVDVVVRMYCKAGIPKGWSAEKKKRAFDHLDELGGGDLIKSELVVKAGRGSSEGMRQLADRVRQIAAELNIHGNVELEPAVQWNSLTAFVKECMGEGLPVDLDALGAHYGEIVEIVDKKE